MGIYKLSLFDIICVTSTVNILYFYRLTPQKSKNVIDMFDINNIVNVYLKNKLLWMCFHQLIISFIHLFIYS